MRKLLITVLVGTTAASLSTVAVANDWEKYYTTMPGHETYLKTTAEPELVVSSGDPHRDIELMWRRGYGPLGYTQFTSNNGKTKDARRLAKKLGATHVVVGTSLLSSQSSSIPLTLPSTTTSTTNGTATVMGSGGSATGNYTGTTTTYGTNTTYIPITINRFEKGAIFFAKVPEGGVGIYLRSLTKDEVAQIDSQRAFAIAYIQDGSPAYKANLLPGDIVAEVNGVPADADNWKAERAKQQPLRLKIFRNREVRELTLVVPPR